MYPKCEISVWVFSLNVKYVCDLVFWKMAYGCAAFLKTVSFSRSCTLPHANPAQVSWHGVDGLSLVCRISQLTCCQPAHRLSLSHSACVYARVRIYLKFNLALSPKSGFRGAADKELHVVCFCENAWVSWSGCAEWSYMLRFKHRL